MEASCQELASRAAVAGRSRIPGAELAACIVKLCELLVGVNARLSALESADAFREYSERLPNFEAPSGASALPSGPSVAIVVDSGEPQNAVVAGRELVAGEAATLAAPEAAPPVAPGDEKKAEPEDDPAAMIAELSERFASMSRKQASLYASRLKAGKASPSQ